MPRNSRLILAKGINLDEESINVLDYTEEEMLNLLRSKEHFLVEQDDFMFIRPQTSIKVDFSYNTCLEANYIAFQNPNYSGKWFFAWIVDVIYISNFTTEIVIKIDSWTTWFSNWKPSTCYVIREHVQDDTIGLHTIQENLDVGEVIQEREIEELSLGEYYWVAIATAWDPEKEEQFDTITQYNRNIFGNQIFLINMSFGGSGYLDLALFIKKTNADGHIADITDIFIIPDTLIDQSTLIGKQGHIGDITFNFYGLPQTEEPNTININIAKQYTFKDYTPKNNKLYVYPYNYILVSNNNGSINTYKYELFNGNNATFNIDTAMGVGVSGICYPTNYKGMEKNLDEALPLGKYPTCGWNADSYVNWLTQNAVNAPLSFVGNLIGIGNMGGNLAQDQTNYNARRLQAEENGNNITSNAGSNIASGFNIAGNIVNAIGSQINSFYTASLLPNIQGGGNTGNVLFSNGKNTFIFHLMRAKTEYLEIIDNYFTRFGYKILKVKKPNITGRKYWNFIEIGKSEIIGTGSVPEIYMNVINNIARRGVTIWHNHANIGNFNLDNTIN